MTRSVIAQNCEAMRRLIKPELRGEVRPDWSLLAVKVGNTAVGAMRKGRWAWLPAAVRAVDPGVCVDELHASTFDLPY